MFSVLVAVNKVKKIHHASGRGVVTMSNVGVGCDEQGDLCKYDKMEVYSLKRRKGDEEQMCSSPQQITTNFTIFRFGVVLVGVFWYVTFCLFQN